MLNRVILIGRLVKDPELKTSKNGKSFLYFTVALNNFSSFNNQNSQNNQAEFIDCIAWEKVAESMGNNLNKGALIAIDGRLQSRMVTRDNTRSKLTEVRAISVKFLQSKGTFNQTGNFKNNNQTQNQSVDENKFDIDNMSFDFVEQNNSSVNENQNLSFDIDDAIAWGE